MARRGETGPHQLSGAVADGAARLFKALSERRGKRIFHPHGVGFRGTSTPLRERGVGASAFEREATVVVRLSRSFGLPEWAPDPCGVGLRIPDAHGDGRHQDVLMVSSARRPIARHAALPSRGFSDRPYSTLLPYELGGRLIVIGARAEGLAPGPSLADLRAREEAGFELVIEIAGLREEWQPLARLSLRPRRKAGEADGLRGLTHGTGGYLGLAAWEPKEGI